MANIKNCYYYKKNDNNSNRNRKPVSELFPFRPILFREFHTDNPSVNLLHQKRKEKKSRRKNSMETRELLRTKNRIPCISIQ